MSGTTKFVVKGALVIGVLPFGFLSAAGPARLNAGAAQDSRTFTFTRDVAPIVFERCAPCHRPGGGGPFSLLTYGEVRSRARQIVEVTNTRVMPPWKPEPGYGEFIGQRRLTEEQIGVIQRWVAEGAVEGDPSNLPPIPTWIEGWQSSKPDLVITLPEPYRLSAQGMDVFRTFVVPIPVSVMRYVKRLEFRLDTTKGIHHANVRVDRTRSSRRLDERDPEPGYEGLISFDAQFPDGHFLGWTPGQLPPSLPEGMAWRLEPDSDLVVQLHMQPTGTPELIQPVIGLFFTDQPPTSIPFMLRLGRQDIDIPAGKKDYVVTDSYVLPVDVEVHAVQPHAHHLAKEVKGVATLPDGTRKWLIYIKDWDFNWQDQYRYVQPFRLPKGTTLSMTYTYDNSTDNRRNPHRPPSRVTWGQTSSNEMGDLWIQVLPRTSDRAILYTEFRQKVLHEDSVGYAKMLEGDPNNAALHDDVALLYLELGTPTAAVAHFRESLRIKPASAGAHYNLAISLTALGSLDEAAIHFRRALAIAPDHVDALINLGAVLHSRGQTEEAVQYYERALQIRPGTAEVHSSLAQALVSQRRVDEAVGHYRRALEINPDLPTALVDLAWILATSPDRNVRAPKQAIQLAERAVTLTGQRDPVMLDTLAEAYAADGRFDRAVATAETALKLALGTRADNLAGQIRSRLERYKLGKAYADPPR